MPELIASLGSERWIERRRAERRLVEFAREAVPALAQALVSEAREIRWGAAKVLSEIGDASAAEALVRALEDEDGGVRWLAAEALVAIGRDSLIPLLRRLLWRADSPWLQEGSHHVLHKLADDTVNPVLAALEGHYPGVTVPAAANEVLERLEAAAS